MTVTKEVKALLAKAWQQGYEQGCTDSASYDQGGKYRGNPYK